LYENLKTIDHANITPLSKALAMQEITMQQWKNLAASLCISAVGKT
jgi:hypothetical protein